MKSSRHSKIAGNFGEALILYWLSKNGFECASVDHTGIDIIARNSITQKLMGISVKTRTRVKGKERESVTIQSDDFTKMDTACEAFGCIPYFAIVVDAEDSIKIFITSKLNFLKLAPKKKHSYWKMHTSALENYSKDEEVMAFELNTKSMRWWKH
jgi:hypothetical protein